MGTNKYGLTRTIPPDVKFEVRKNCGFGCVICGTAIVEYDHFNPEFKDAIKHEPSGITLLCPTDHARKTRLYLSKETILKATKNPKALQQGFSHEQIDIETDRIPEILIGGGLFSNCPIPIMVSNNPIIEVDFPETKGGPFRISATFYDTKGNKTLEISKNEWKSFTSNWDLEVTAGKIIVKDENNVPHLIMN